MKTQSLRCSQLADVIIGAKATNQSTTQLNTYLTLTTDLSRNLTFNSIFVDSKRRAHFDAMNGSEIY